MIGVLESEETRSRLAEKRTKLYEFMGTGDRLNRLMGGNTGIDDRVERWRVLWVQYYCAEGHGMHRVGIWIWLVFNRRGFR